MAAVEIEVTREEAGERVDVVLARRIPGLSRARAKELIERGGVEVAGRRVRKSRLLKEGEKVTVERLPEPSDFHARPDTSLRLDVLAEREGYVVVAKPAGVPSHPLRGDELGTLAGALVARYPEMRDVGYGPREPGLVHRLDTGTSGVMVAAREQATFERLRRLLREGAIEKRYLARCVGRVEAPQVVETPLANDPKDRRRVRASVDPREIERLGAQPAVTEILSSHEAPQGCLVEVRANHARRHQIRVHLASIGHPLLGDPLYGGPELADPQHHLLHASSITIDGETIEAAPWEYARRSVTIK